MAAAFRSTRFLITLIYGRSSQWGRLLTALNSSPPPSLPTTSHIWDLKVFFLWFWLILATTIGLKLTYFIFFYGLYIIFHLLCIDFRDNVFSCKRNFILTLDLVWKKTCSLCLKSIVYLNLREEKHSLTPSSLPHNHSTQICFTRIKDVLLTKILNFFLIQFGVPLVKTIIWLSPVGGQLYIFSPWLST